MSTQDPLFNEPFASRVLIGQSKVRDSITRIFSSGRMAHAYLFTGPEGSGKMAAALAFAEAVNGVSHLTNLGDASFSTKSSWLHHPDIHVFFPVPTQVAFKEIQQRIEALAQDPYAVIDFGSLGENSDKAKNRRAFYPAEYYEKEIRPTIFLSPNEGQRTVVILAEVDTMRKEVANAFLKLLEEPPPQVMFILTSSQPESLLPTIISRCQNITFTPTQPDELAQALSERKDMDAGTAAYLARISAGNYRMAANQDSAVLRKQRDTLVQFLRASYSVDAVRIANISEQWAKELNSDAVDDLLSMMEMLLRDISLYAQTSQNDLLINIDQLEMISKFSSSLQKARIDAMIDEIANIRHKMVYNVNVKLLFVVLATRFARLMRGLDTVIPETETWRHIPHLS